MYCKFDYFISTCACCLSVCHCALPGRLWLHLLSKHPLSSCRHPSDTPEASLLYAEQMHLPQPLVAHHVVQAPDQLGEPTLGSLQYVHVCLVLGSPKLDSTLQVQSHKCRIEGNNHFSQLAAITLNCHQKTRSCWSLTLSFHMTSSSAGVSMWICVSQITCYTRTKVYFLYTPLKYAKCFSPL